MAKLQWFKGSFDSIPADHGFAKKATTFARQPILSAKTVGDDYSKFRTKDADGGYHEWVMGTAQAKGAGAVAVMEEGKYDLSCKAGTFSFHENK